LNFTLIYTRWRRCLDPFQTWIMTIDSPRNWSQALAISQKPGIVQSRLLRLAG
jgi:hypothetical protein